jgi:CRISPR/Cas system endoribonuclease Cas6 (RAMP superfamily)
MAEKFQCYASGSGALSFVWLDDRKQVATSRPVTREDVEAFLHRAEEKHLLEKGWKIVELNGQLLLVHPVKRIDENTIQFEEYTYKLHLDSPERRGHQWIGSSDFTLLFHHPELGDLNVENVNTRAAVRFWLEHEKELEGKL